MSITWDEKTFIWIRIKINIKNKIKKIWWQKDWMAKVNAEIFYEEIDDENALRTVKMTIFWWISLDDS